MEDKTIVLETAEENFCDALVRWNESYRDMPNDWRFSDGRSVDEQRKMLAAARTVEEFDAAMGNKSWTHLSCDACGSEERAAIILRQRYSDKTFTACRKCLQRANALISVVSFGSQP